MTTPLAVRVFESEARWYRRVWRGSVVSSFLNPVLYLVAMGLGLGTLVDANLPEGVEGVSYLTFLAPGLLAATAMQTGAGEGSWKIMAGIKWTKTYNARLATPIGVPDLVVGLMLWAGFRVLLVSFVFALVMVLFRVAPLWQTLLAIGPALLVGLAMAAATTSFTVRIKNDVNLAMFFRFVVIPMFLFSGVFFPIAQLPGWLQPVAFITPLWHGVEMCRAIVIGTTPPVPVWISVSYLVTWIALGTTFAIGPFRKRLTP